MSFTAITLGACKHPRLPLPIRGPRPVTPYHPLRQDIVNQYEKHYDEPTEPLNTQAGGYRTYVVSEPDASYKHYQVPAGAYPTSEPYVNFGARRRLTSLAMGGVGESSAVRFRSAPGEMGRRGGGDGGLGLMDKEGTRTGLGSLAERNPAPDEPAVAEQYSTAGLEGAWKLRK
ncbi:hypothetical protein CPB84DRAFT_1747645 [Gymnopilus junonius]|uniref:Uncharacterized protein n=1 Tax=Gymnopilus junonius TaxID=109634 RepID=A0A9P5NPW5_GYMJU|nr:hypothetical protein CPB84DRAFT_1747645 [Gymnopilus junonius]